MCECVLKVLTGRCHGPRTDSGGGNMLTGQCPVICWGVSCEFVGFFGGECVVLTHLHSVDGTSLHGKLCCVIDVEKKANSHF